MKEKSTNKQSPWRPKKGRLAVINYRFALGIVAPQSAVGL